MNTDHLNTSLATLEASLIHLKKAKPHSIDYEIYRNATIKGFELSLETAGKLLRKALKTYVENPQALDKLTFKDLLRTATKHQLFSVDGAERWMQYRDNRNNTAHDYGIEFAEGTLKLPPHFIEDARELEQKLHAIGENIA